MAAPAAGVRLSLRAEAFWSGFLGVAAQALREPGVSVVPHARLAGWSGVWFWERGRSVVVSAPAEWVGALRAETPARLPALAREPEALRALFGDRLGEVIGPALSIARRLGFVQYASHVAVRLRVRPEAR